MSIAHHSRSSNNNNSNSNYRDDIDGLRGVAVLLVVVFHVVPSLLTGGFVGVDVFFVISGFVVTQRLLSESSSFSLSEFYAARVKRLFPSAALCVFACLCVGALFFVPTNNWTRLEALASSSVAALLGVTNMRESFLALDYFAADSEQNPLLHLWSLAVEEQFYLVWPFVVGTFGLADRPVVLAIVAAASFALSEYLPLPWAFYLFFGRIGEFLCGVAVLYALRNGVTVPLGVSNFMSVIGIAIVGYCSWFYDSTTPFPGSRAAVCCLGTALVIFCGADKHEAILSKMFLKWAPLVWVGRVSYNVYLWHWPLLAFARFNGVFFTSWTDRSHVMLYTFVIAYVVHEVVEKPIRRMSVPSARIFVCMFVVLAALLALSGFILVCASGNPLNPGAVEQVRVSRNRNNSTVSTPQNVSVVWKSSAPTKINCPIISNNLAGPGGVNPERDVTLAGDLTPGLKPSFLVLGDSHAGHFVPLLDVLAKSRKRRFINSNLPGCAPILLPTMKGEAACVPLCHLCDLARAKVWPGLIAQYDRIVLATSLFIRWYDRIGIPVFNSVAVDCPVIEGTAANPCWQTHLHRDTPVAEKLRHLSKFLAQFGNVRYWDADALICPDGVCKAYSSRTKHLLYIGPSHLSCEGARELGEDLLQRWGIPYELEFLFS